jgi:transcriptional regulator with XRE-family HTH domain
MSPTIAAPGSDVKTKLDARGWTCSRLAQRLGVSRAMISRVVHGSRVSPGLQEAIAEVANLETADLFGDLYWRDRLLAKVPGIESIRAARARP